MELRGLAWGWSHPPFPAQPGLLLANSIMVNAPQLAADPAHSLRLFRECFRAVELTY